MADENKGDGMNYAPKGKPNPVVKTGEFTFAAAHLEHGHIYGMCNGLTEAGAEIKWVYDPDPKKVAAFLSKYPEAKVARNFEEILNDPTVKLVAGAAVPSERGSIGGQVMEAGKDYFTDKTPFTTLDQISRAKSIVQKTNRKYMVYFSERIHVESAMFAGDLIHEGAIGRVLQVVNLAPHRLSKASRPDWFWKKENYGGILCDIGSHQFEQFLFYSGAKDATVVNASVANYGNPDKPEFEDFGDANLVADNGATNYIRVDWFTPDGLRTWGDGRCFILGTKGFIEIRKYIDLGHEATTDHLYLVDGRGEQHFDLAGKVGFRFFGELIIDCLNRTEKAMPQDHVFRTAELCIKAQASARRISTET